MTSYSRHPQLELENLEVKLVTAIDGQKEVLAKCLEQRRDYVTKHFDLVFGISVVTLSKCPKLRILFENIISPDKLPWGRIIVQHKMKGSNTEITYVANNYLNIDKCYDNDTKMFAPMRITDSSTLGGAFCISNDATIDLKLYSVELDVPEPCVQEQRQESQTLCGGKGLDYVDGALKTVMVINRKDKQKELPRSKYCADVRLASMKIVIRALNEELKPITE